MSFKPEHFTVWMEIPVTDLKKACAFYETVLETKMILDDTGPNEIAMFPTGGDGKGVAGHLYEGRPAASGTGSTIHLAVPGKLEEAMGRVAEAGGTVVSDPITIPPGRFAYLEDPDGNSIGLFEAA